MCAFSRVVFASYWILCALFPFKPGTLLCCWNFLQLSLLNFAGWHPHPETAPARKTAQLNQEVVAKTGED